MNLREETERFSEKTYRRTDQQCYHCEDGTILKDEAKSEKFCDSCYVVIGSERLSDQSQDAAVRYKADVQSHHESDAEERTRLCGGFADAYWDNGEEYTFDLDEGEFLTP